MHCLRFTALAIGIVLLLNACRSSDTSSAIAYNDRIVDGMHLVDKAFFAYLDAAGSYSPALMAQRADTLQSWAGIVASDLKNMEVIEEGAELRMAALAYLDYIQGPGKLRIGAVLQLLGTGVTDTSGLLISEIDLRHDTLVKDTDALFNKITQEQEKFAETFGFELDE